MPQYDYDVEVVSTFGGGSLPETFKGTVEATDPQTACAIAFIHVVHKEPQPWTGNWESWFAAHGYTDGSDPYDSYGEAWEDRDPTSPEQFPTDGETAVILLGDYDYEVTVLPHDPDRFLRPEEVQVVVTLSVRATEATGRNPDWEWLKSVAADRVRVAINEHLDRGQLGSVLIEVHQVSSL